MDTVHFRRTLSRPCCLPPATLQSFSAEYAAAAPWPSLYLAYDGHSVNLKKQTGDLEVFALVFCFVSCLFVFDKKKKSHFVTQAGFTLAGDAAWDYSTDYKCELPHSQT